MINYVLKKVNGSVLNNSQMYKKKFEFALTNLDKVLQESKLKKFKQKLNH